MLGTPPPSSPPTPRTVRGRFVAWGAGAVLVLVAPLLVATDATAAGKIAVAWSDTDVKAGRKVVARVEGSSRPHGTRLVLQRRFPDHWRSADATARRDGDTFVLRVPTDQFGRLTYRVAAKDGSKVVATSKTRTIQVRTGWSPRGRARQHLFSATPRTRWDSCRTIRWAFSRGHAPRHALSQLKRGVARVHAATGLEFDYVGRTKKKPRPQGRSSSRFDVVVGWRTKADYALFRNQPRVVGVGGNSYYPGYRTGDGTAASLAFQGGVVLNAAQDRNLGNGFGRGYTWGEVIVHELGHVVGLAHPAADTQIMYATVRRRNASWGAGDLAGLRKVGDRAGCMSREVTRAADEPLVGTFVSP